jgi:N-acetylgalactosamine-N,N'-diacetylbacillosaminyl-diphospho-undecaprenol 4-alpha-N-acetylgalactosaminyltransferase
VEQIIELNLEDRVFLLGKQKNPYKYLAKADCFAFASKREGFPNVLVEALACQLPIISTDCKSGPREILAPESDVNFQLRERVEIANYGILTPINSTPKMVEAMKVIMKSKKLRDSYIEKSLKRVKEFDKDVMINRFIELL